MDNREDVLRVAYNLESLTSYLVGMSFRISHLNSGTVTKTKLEEPLRQLVEYVLEMVHRLNEVVRSLAINPDSAWELAGSVQSVEREIDDLYRNLTIEVLKTAVHYGAKVINYVKADEFIYNNGKIAGIKCID